MGIDNGYFEKRMMRLRLDNCAPCFGDLFLKSFASNEIPKKFSSDFVFTGSGKAALSVVLQFLRENKILKDKMSQVLVPQWVGIAVYQAILSQCFITTCFTKDVKAIIAYHQYGFPQNMDKLLEFCQEKKVILIEDCAHVIDSKYKNIPVGSFGDFSIYSFSKFCFCFALGGISFKNSEFEDFFRKKKKESSCFLKCLINFFKFIDEFSMQNWVNFENAREMSYSLYHKSLRSSSFSENLFFSKLQDEIFLRKNNYNYLREKLRDYDFMSLLEPDVVPYAVPLMIKKNRDKIISTLKEKGIESGEYWFDVNRLVIEPRFERCALIPIHSKVKFEHIDFITDTIKKFL